VAKGQQALAAKILQDPAVASLTSFIGVDGTNTTLNSGRIQINLKPLDERKASASDIIRRLTPVLAQVPDIKLFMQPVQDLTVEDRVSRTQYQFSMEDADPKELGYWVPRFVDRIKTIPVLRDVASDQQNSGLQTRLVIDRTSASRLGITPQMLDDALYDAFGQRQISTIYTDLTQYHVILENKPGMATGPEALNQVFLRSAAAARCRSAPSPASRPAPRPWR